MTVSEQVRKQANRAWRKDFEPSEESQAALQEVIETGSLSNEAREAVIDELVEAIPERQRDLNRDAGENGLFSAVRVVNDGIELRISKRLFKQQPLGVICRPVHHRVNGEGSAVITDVCPRSADVDSEIMAVEHISLHIVPMPVWLNRYIGTENGYEMFESDE